MKDEHPTIADHLQLCWGSKGWPGDMRPKRHPRMKGQWIGATFGWKITSDLKSSDIDMDILPIWWPSSSFSWCWRGELWISLVYWPSLNLLSSWVVIKYNMHVLKQSGIPKTMNNAWDRYCRTSMLGEQHHSTFAWLKNTWRIDQIAVEHLQVLIRNHGDVPEPRWTMLSPVGKSFFGPRYFVVWNSWWSY